MIGWHRAECDRHAAALLEFAETRTAGPGVQAALDHAARCPACEQDLAEAELLVTRLRRLGAMGRRVDPPEGGWARLGARLSARSRGRPAPRLSPLAGVMLVPALVVALLAPTVGSAITGTGAVSIDALPTGSAVARQAPRDVDRTSSGSIGDARWVDDPPRHPSRVAPTTIVTLPAAGGPLSPAPIAAPAIGRASTRT